MIYPEESKVFNQGYLEKKYDFTLGDMVIAEIGSKKYYVLLIQSSDLLFVRRKHGLPEKLNFKNYEIGFHITVGVSND